MLTSSLHSFFHSFFHSFSLFAARHRWLGGGLFMLCGLAAAQTPLPMEPSPVPELLLSAPRFPPPSQVPAPVDHPAHSTGRSALTPAAGGLVIDTQDREAVRLFYQGLFGQSDGVAMNWTGNYATGAAGSTNPLYQDATVLRINWHRAMAGIPADVGLYAPYSEKDQQAALMMSANNALSHTPPSSWTYYTADGAEAANNSNLALGNAGPDAVSAGYVKDPGSNNAAVGHRRWILYPQTKSMGTGDVPGGTLNGASLKSANALWVFDSNVNGARPTVRDTFVAWPPKGYVPYPVVYGRWSFSYPQADFSQASVSVRKNGSALAVTTEPVQNGYGENTLVWLLQGYTNSATWSRPGSDDTYAVTIDNVRLNGSAQSFSYDVIVFDPATVTPGAARTTVNVPASGATAAQPFTVSVNPMTGATGYQIGSYSQSALPASLTPGNSANAWTYTTSGYNPLESSWFHLYHASYSTQTLTLGKRLLAGQNAQLSFDRSFGFTSSNESASVQLSLDDGMSWQSIYSEAGQNGPLAQASKTVDLSAFAGKLFQLRFVFEASGTYYTCTTCGWYFGNLLLSNATELTSQETVNFTGAQTSGTMSLPEAGSYALFARTQYQNMYFGDWGSMASLTVAAASQTAPACSLSANPATINAGSSATLTATCTPAATSYIWSYSTCDPSTSVCPAIFQELKACDTAKNTCTVTPTEKTIYTVMGVNASGVGAGASTTVTISTTTNTTTYTVPGTLGSDVFVLTDGNSYYGGGGNDTYIISPNTLRANVTARIIDTEGDNLIQLVDGMTVTASAFYSDAAQLTLSSGARVQILGASKFKFQVGANAPAGDTATALSYTDFVTSLGASLTSGTLPAAGTAGYVVPTGFTQATPVAAVVGNASTVPGTLGDDVLVPSGGNNYLGGGGNDTYIISPYTLNGSVTAKIIDTEGTNTIQLVNGLTVASSSFFENAVQLTLSSGAIVQVLGASGFGYQLGANAPAGETVSSVAYAQFAATLGASVPTGTSAVSGTTSFVVQRE